MMGKNIELVKTLLKEHNVNIHPRSYSVMVYATKGNKSLVCSWLGSNLTISASVNGKANREVSEKLVNKIFGKVFVITPLTDCPMDNIHSNYFSLEYRH